MAARQTDKRDRLIQTAATLVYQQGFHQTTLADIAKLAQVPLGTVYYFFKTKEDLGEAVVEYRLRELREQVGDRTALRQGVHSLKSMPLIIHENLTQG